MGGWEKIRLSGKMGRMERKKGVRQGLKLMTSNVAGLRKLVLAIHWEGLKNGKISVFEKRQKMGHWARKRDLKRADYWVLLLY